MHFLTIQLFSKAKLSLASDNTIYVDNKDIHMVSNWERKWDGY